MLNICLCKQLSEIERLIDAFEVYADEHQIPVSVATKISIAMDEIVSNLMQYALDNPDTDQEINISIAYRNHQLQVVVSDPGPPFDPLRVPSPDISASLEDRTIGGLGIHMARNLMDEIVYERVVDKNVLTLTINARPS